MFGMWLSNTPRRGIPSGPPLPMAPYLTPGQYADAQFMSEMDPRQGRYAGLSEALGSLITTGGFTPSESAALQEGIRGQGRNLWKSGQRQVAGTMAARGLGIGKGGSGAHVGALSDLYKGVADIQLKASNEAAKQRRANQAMGIQAAMNQRGQDVSLRGQDIEQKKAARQNLQFGGYALAPPPASMVYNPWAPRRPSGAGSASSYLPKRWGY